MTSPKLNRSSSLCSLNGVDETFNEDLFSEKIEEKPKNNINFERKFILSKGI